MRVQVDKTRDLFCGSATRLGLVITLLFVALGVHGAEPYQEEAKLLAADGALDDFFGSAAALSQDTALIGAWGDDDLGRQSGSAYVFVRSGPLGDPRWSQQEKLLPEDGAVRDFFGQSVALEGDTAVVGAPLDDLGGRSDAGSAYVFVRSGSPSDPHWTQQAKLVADDGELGDQFGRSVAISGDTVLVGAREDSDQGDASGAAYVFVRTGSTWAQQAKLLAADGAAYDRFGTAVAVSGDTALVGAVGHEVDSEGEGAVYVFVRTGSPSGPQWTQQAKLTAADSSVNAHFGNAVALEGDTALIGAAWKEEGGAAYVFVRSGSSGEPYWTQQAKLTAADSAGLFGYPVSLSGDQALIGAPNTHAQGVVFSGAAYLFARAGTTWTQQAQLVASDGAPRDNFGSSVALAGNTAVIGAHHDDDMGSDSGSAYVFVASPEPPTLHVSPPSLVQEVPIGDALTRTLTLSNLGESDLAFELSTLAGAGSTLPQAQEVPWLTVDPVSGTVAGGGEQAVEVTLDATGAEVGDYNARIRIQSNDPLTPTLDVPVTMTVRAAITTGRVQGTVTDADTGAPLAATVSVLGQPDSTDTDPSGGYELTLEAGSYTLQVTSSGYLSQMATVDVVAEQTTTQDFSLTAAPPDQFYLYLPIVFRQSHAISRN